MMSKPGIFFALMGASAFFAIVALIGFGVILDMRGTWLIRFVAAPLLLAELTFGAIAIVLMVREVER